MKTQKIKNLLVIAILTISNLTNAQEKLPPTPLEIFNEYLATYADTEPTYCTEITLGMTDNQIPQPPYRIGQSDILKTYTYRPRKFTELSPQEQVGLENDIRFRAYLVRKEKENKTTIDTFSRGNYIVARQEPSSTPADIIDPKNTVSITLTPKDITDEKELILIEQ